jgi:peptide/nickel transport system permease protein
VSGTEPIAAFETPGQGEPGGGGVASAETTRRPKSVRGVWRQPLAITGFALIIFWVGVALFAPVIAPADPLAQVFPRFQPPSAENWFGTDGVGRDVLSRVIYGARISIPLAVLLVTLAGTIGSLAGGIAGYFGGRVDSVIMRLVDLFFAFPTIILAMAVAAALGPDLQNAVLAIVVVAWPTYARVVRGLVLSQKEMDYVAATRLLGASSRRSLLRDVMPNVGGPVMVLATLELGNAVLLLAGLSFLGLGARPPSPEWGAMVSDGAQTFDRWWVGTFPGIAILTVVMAFNFLGDSLRDALDPRTARAIRGRE